MPPRACRVCDEPFIGTGQRCATHKRLTGTTRDHRYDDPAYRRTRRRMLSEHVRSNGYWCPGFGRPPHQATDLSLDHLLELSRGGALIARDNLRVLCRSCNSRKRHAKQR